MRRNQKTGKEKGYEKGRKIEEGDVERNQGRILKSPNKRDGE